MAKRYCILGGGCSFALHTSMELLKAPGTESVLAIGRHEPSLAHKLLRVGEGDSRYRYAEADVCDTEVVLSWIDNASPDTIINFAAEGESVTSFTQSWKYFETNAVALSRLVEELDERREYLNRFIQVSSGEVYGSVSTPAYETDKVNPTSPYAASKAAFDAYLMAMAKRKGFPANIVRPSNTFGEGQQHHRIIPKSILYGLTNRKVPLYGSGGGVKSYLHVSDLARGIAAVADRAPLRRIYNLAPRTPMSTRNVVEAVAAHLDMPATSLFYDTGSRRGTDACYWLDSNEAKRDIGWEPHVSFDQGIARTVAWMRAHLKELVDVKVPERHMETTTG